jgi:hypothetical protein
MTWENSKDYESWQKVNEGGNALALWGTALLINCDVIRRIGFFEYTIFCLS